ncbi:hypothetical protein JIR001_14930 [Polycladomyces abyssicola]|uniref:Aspartate 1-decarboxylase n=1 Tax=Polycladomyces abyssicola TaxID=1125966 RepID=A0A8D5UEI6_9BACL|nr:hypothetical protein JIR001_14930 [Polycladomyces abyssicola]
METYVISGPRGSGIICLNGAAARLVQPGDIVIIISYIMLDEAEAKSYRSRVAVMGEGNVIKEMLVEEVHGTEQS